ncbi:MAG: NAD(P)/FAD-dependent oxidoreductase [Acidobacteriota bacterium]
MVNVDAVVVGGGVAGSVVARELGLRGVRVALLEKAQHPRPKPCGEGLLPHGVAALGEMGLHFPGTRVKGLRYVSPSGLAAEGDFPSGYGMVVRREKFDAFLFEAAADTPNVDVHPNTAYDPERWKARWLIGADGLHSQFHRRPEFSAWPPSVRRVGLSTHMTGLDVDPERVEVIFHDSGEVYLAPAGDGEALVACLYRQKESAPQASNEERVLETLFSLDQLRGRRHALAFTTPVRGAGPLGLSVRTIATGGTLLVGDAAGAPDPVVGEGMSLAILSARAAAKAIATGRPHDYQNERRRLAAGADWMAGWILRASGRAFLTNRLVASLKRHPELFTKLIEIASGDREKSELTFGDLACLAA